VAAAGEGNPAPLDTGRVFGGSLQVTLQLRGTEPGLSSAGQRRELILTSGCSVPRRT
jgi:hypothetical protein